MLVDHTQHTTNPNIRFGKPCIKGTRIAVADVLGWLANGMTAEEIKRDFPELTDEQIRACVASEEEKKKSS